MGLETESRRERVRWLKQNGITRITELANQLGVHRNTIGSDIKALESDDRKRITEGDAHQILGETDGTLAMVEEELLATYHSLPKNAYSERMAVMKEVRSTRLSRIKLLFDTGALPRIQNTQDWNVATEYRSMETPQITQRAKKLIAEISRDLGEPVPEHEELIERNIGKPSAQVRWKAKREEMADGIPIIGGSPAYPAPPPERETVDQVREAFGGEPPIDNPLPNKKTLPVVETEAKVRDDNAGTWWQAATDI